jgi:hypothetical protein
MPVPSDIPAAVDQHEGGHRHLHPRGVVIAYRMGTSMPSGVPGRDSTVTEREPHSAEVQGRKTIDDCVTSAPHIDLNRGNL